MRSHRNRRGFALPAAVGALVIIGVLVTAGFYMAQQEVKIGVASSNAQMAFYLAERGANDVVNDWSASTMLNLATWTDTTLVDTLDIGTWSVNVKRMATRLFYLDATGTVTQGGTQFSGATRRAGLLVRLFSGELDPPAALTTRGSVAMKGTADVHGEDEYPAGWGSVCTSSLADKPGLITNDTSGVSYDAPEEATEETISCSSDKAKVGKSWVTTETCDTVPAGGATGGNITGVPHMVEDTTINDSTFLDFGELKWDDLVAMADLTVTSLGSTINGTGPDTTSAGVCTKSTLTNWGNPVDPVAACGDYFPIIYHGGSTVRIQSGGVGQGLLLIEGDLDLRGGFQFNGIIIVQGEFETQGSGNRVEGGVMASNVDLAEQSLVGGSQIQYSSCAIERAILNNDGLTRARPLAMRSFIDLSNVIN